MEQKLKSQGVCSICGKTFAKAGMSRHLKSHFEATDFTIKKEVAFLLKVEANPRYDSRPFFLYLWVSGKIKLEAVDDFLRDIWLECCGHMSKFIDQHARIRAKYAFGSNMFDMIDAMDYLEDGNKQMYEKIMEESYGEIPMSRTLEKALFEGQKIEYEYDFGSSTNLLITVEKKTATLPKKNIVLLSRNEPLKIMCEMCGRNPAVHVCTIHHWTEDTYFCEKCSTKHAKNCPDFEDFAKLPFVNSPRVGVCGYEGGTIDIERDGVYKE